MAGDDLIVDLTNYKDRVGNRVVPGRYTVVVEDAESDTAKTGNPMVNLWLRVQGGEFDGATIVDRLVIDRTQRCSDLGVGRVHLLLLLVLHVGPGLHESHRLRRCPQGR